PDDLFVDVGANIGAYTVLASAVCGARSIAVEPDPSTMRSLRRNIEVNDIAARVSLVEAALGSEQSTVRFTIGLDTANRVASESDPNTREVQLRTLDEIIGGRNARLIKMDVEGYEAQVVEGATGALRNPSLLAVLIETVDEAIHARVERAGFCRAY